MRLIDADALLDKCYHAYPSIDHYCISRSVVDTNDIIHAPTIEAEPTKYKWHDLRKNPNDLPRKDGTYRCVFKDDINNYFTCDYRNGIGFGEECFDAHNELTGSPIEYYFECYDEDDEVIGWQVIDRYEVSN